MINKIPLESVASITSTSSIFSPVSAIKELIDNSIDANANSISIDLDTKTCGLQYIQLKDNGDGIPKDDRHLLFLNHTTSKISKTEDIFTVNTLGFRGEALFFINQLTFPNGSIEISTKTSIDKLRESWKIGKDGELLNSSLKKISIPNGTIIKIQNIFKKIPVRYKILIKNSKFHKDKIKQLIWQYSLIHPNIKFHLKFINFTPKDRQSSSISSQEIYHSKDPLQSISQHFNQLEFFHNSTIINNWEISVILPKMDSDHHTNLPLKLISINKRLITLSMFKKLNKILNNVYESLKLFKPSVWFIQLTNHDDKIDVNIEPEKNDVLIINELDFLESLENFLLKCVVEGHDLIENVDESGKEDDELVEINNEEMVETDNLVNKEKEVGIENIDQFEIQNHDNMRDQYVETNKAGINPNHNSLDITNDTIDWSHNMHDNLSSRSNTRTNTIESLPKPDNQEEEEEDDDEDESFKIAKDTTISNPFTLTNLRYNSSNKSSINHLPTPDNSIDEIKNNKQTFKLPNPPKLLQTKTTHPIIQQTLQTKRYKLSSFQYLQSFHLKIIPKFDEFIINEDYQINSNNNISSNILNFVKQHEGTNFEILNNEAGLLKIKPKSELQ